MFVLIAVLIIETSKQLDIILLELYDSNPVSGHQQKRPSWVPDFQQTTKEQEIFKTLRPRASGSLVSVYSFNDNMILCTKGIQLGIIQRTNSTIRFSDPTEWLISDPPSSEIIQHLRSTFQMLEVSLEPLESTLKFVTAFSRHVASAELLIALLVRDYVPQLDRKATFMLRTCIDEK